MRVTRFVAVVAFGGVVWACSSTDESTLGGGSSSGSHGSSSSSSGSSGSSGGTSSGASGSSSGASSGASGTSSGSSGSSSGASSGSSGSQDAGKDTGAAGNDSGSADPFAAARALCVKTINDYRATVKLPPLVQDFAKEACTDGEAKSDGMSNKPHGAFGTCGETAQDECPNYPGPPEQLVKTCLAQMWAEGPGGGHYDNMTTTSRTKVSCGFYQLPGGSWWAPQNFY